MTKDTKIKELIINKLTTAQYDSIAKKDPNQLYLVTDAGVSGVNLFDHKWSDHILNDMSWLRADTFSWQDGTFYSNAYNHLVNDFSSGTKVLDDTGVWYYSTPDGHKIVDASDTVQVTNVENLYNTTGVTWYYILDVANKRFKLPRTKYGFTGIRDSVGKYVPESLPKPTLIMRTDSSSSTDTDLNAIYGNDGYTAATPTNTVGVDEYMHRTYTNGNMAYMDIFHSSYQDGAPVQQRATQMYLYFYVGNYTKSATEQTAGITTEVLNGKLDTELGNATATTKQTVVGWGMPDYSARYTLTLTKTPQTVSQKSYIIVATHGYLGSVIINDVVVASGAVAGYDSYMSLQMVIDTTDNIKVDGNNLVATIIPLKGVN